MNRDPDKQIRRHLQAILEATSDLLFEVGVPETADDLLRIQQLAFGECIRRVGEAVAQIDSIDAAWLTTNFPGIPWGDVKATRNRLSHDYWTVDYTILNAVAVDDLPAVTTLLASHLSMDDPYRLLDPTQVAVDTLAKLTPAQRRRTARTYQCQGRRTDSEQCERFLLPASTCPKHKWTAPKW